MSDARAALAVLAVVLAAVPVACDSSGEPSEGEATSMTTGAAPEPSEIAISDVTLPPVLPPPVAVEQLSPGLLSSDAVGVPDSWTALDLDPAIVSDPDLAGDVDAFRGALDCESDPVHDEIAPWIARRYITVDFPLDNGIVAVETVLQVQDEDGFDRQVESAKSCRPAAAEAVVEWSDGHLEPSLVPVDEAVRYHRVSVSSPPTETAPFPVAFDAVFANTAGFSVIVIIEGDPNNMEWDRATTEIAGTALARLVDVPR